MSANFYCWEPSLKLHPDASDFLERVDALHDNPPPEASPVLLDFVKSLLARYPDVGGTENTIWAAGPLHREILGQFINFVVLWSAYTTAIPFIVETAHAHHLHCYDPQDGRFYPVGAPA